MSGSIIEKLLAGTIILLTITLIWIISPLFHRMLVYGEIQEFNASKSTFYNMRMYGEDLEVAAAILDVADVNRWLAVKQYWNETIFDWYIPDEVMELEPINLNKGK